jgi:hypothetical protein
MRFSRLQPVSGPSRRSENQVSYPAGDAVTDDDDSGPAGQRSSDAGSHRRSWWRWLLVGALLIFSLLITALYLISLTADLLQHRWGEALDASRVAVPAAVGWAALLIIFFGRGPTPADRLLSADQRAVREKQARSERNEDSLRRAEQRVQDLTASLAALFAGLGAAADPQNDAAASAPSSPLLARQVAETTARLDQARQWLASARAALAASPHDVADAPEKTRTEKLTTENLITANPISANLTSANLTSANPASANPTSANPASANIATENPASANRATANPIAASPPSFSDRAEAPGCSEGRVGWLRRSRTKMSLAEVRSPSCPGLNRGRRAGSPRLHLWLLGP